MAGLAALHQQRVHAARLTASGGRVAPGNAAPAAPKGPAATAYERMLMQLAEDRRRLKDIQSVKAKIELKRELLPSYRAWVQGVLEAAASTGRAVQDEVLVTVMIWLIDTGNFEDALPLVEHALRYRLALPERYERDLPSLAAEEVAEAALSALSRGEAFDLNVLLRIDELTAGHDMVDQIRAKLNKAIGLELASRAEADDPDAGTRVAGYPAAARAEALARLYRAIDLNQSVGVKKDIDRLERAVKADAEAKTAAFAAAQEKAAAAAKDQTGE